MKRLWFMITFFSGWSWAEPVQLTSPLPLPITGNITANFTPPAITTVSFNGVAQPVTATFAPPALTTVTFNGAAQPVTGTFFQNVQPVSGAVFVATTSVSLNGSSNTVILGAGSQSIGSISNTGFNVNNVPTVLLSTAAVNGSTVAVTNGVGTTLAVTGTVNAAQSGAFTLTNTTVGVVNGGAPFNATINTALPSGTNNLGTVSGSSITIFATSGGFLPVQSSTFPALDTNGNLVSSVASMARDAILDPSLRYAQPVVSFYLTRIQEEVDLTLQQVSLRDLINSESQNSQRMSYEIR